MTMQLALVLASITFTIDAREQVRRVEERMRQFPPAEVAANFFAMSAEHYSWVQKTGAVIPTHRREAYTAHLADAERLYDAWSYLDAATRLLEEARCLAVGRRMPIHSFLVETVESKLACARKCVNRLETLLGEEAFCAGRMPPPVPYWRFQRID
jgi:hypothetical protein